MRPTPRDLINVGIFAALYIVVLFGVSMLGVLNPVIMFVSLFATVVINGVVFMLFLTRVHKPGMIALFSIIVGIFLFLTGHPLVALAAHVVLGLVAELIWRAGSYRNPTYGVVTYAVYCLWYLAPLSPIFYASDAYFADLARQMDNNQAYAEGLRQLATVPMLIGFEVAVFVLGLVGGMLGRVMLRKHFTRAGVA